MGTRGIFGFRYKGRHYLIWNQMDSYRSGLGMELIKAIKEAIKNGDKTLEKWKQLLLKIKVVSEESKPSEEDKKNLSKYGQINNWCDLEEKTYQSPASILESGYLVECSPFSYDVEYSYLIDLDSHCLIFYEYQVPYDWRNKNWNDGEEYDFDDLPEKEWECNDRHSDQKNESEDDEDDNDNGDAHIIQYDTKQLNKEYLVVSNNDQTVEWVEKKTKNNDLDPCWLQIPTLARLKNGKFLVDFKVEEMADAQIGLGFLIERRDRDGSNPHFDWGFFGYLGSSMTGVSYDPSTGDVVTDTRSICGGLPKLKNNKGKITLNLDLSDKSEKCSATFVVDETPCSDMPYIVLPKGVVIMPAVCLLKKTQKVTIKGPLTLL